MAENLTLPDWAKNARAKRQSATPHWVKKVSRAKRKRTVECEHPIEFQSDTVTFQELRSKVWDATSTVASALEGLGVPAADKWKLASNVFDQLDDLGPKLWRDLCAEAAKEFERSNKVEELSVGSVSYQLHSPLKAHIAPSADHGWEYSVDRFSPRFFGKGDSIAAAQRDFLNTVHSVFQTLVQMRPFQMDDAQKADWKVLDELIDISQYWGSVPVTLLEIGVVSAVTPEGREVVWLDGERKELVMIGRTLPKFGAFGEGQWFEALVERQPESYELQKLSYVRPIDPVREMSDDEFRQWVESLPTGDDVPKSGTDWATL